MNEELKKKLLGKLPYSTSAKETFTPDLFDDVPKKYQPKVTIKPMTKAQKDRGTAAALDGDTKEMMTLCKECIVTIDNLIEVSTDEVIPYDEKVFDELLPDQFKLTVYYRVAAISGLQALDKMAL